MALQVMAMRIMHLEVEQEMTAMVATVEAEAVVATITAPTLTPLVVIDLPLTLGMVVMDITITTCHRAIETITELVALTTTMEV